MRFMKTYLLAVAATMALPAFGQSTYKSTLPLKPSKDITVAGTVECDGKPVAGVLVSDGYEITKTDKKGAYYLKSGKQNPQVFIISPSGYEPWREDAVPQFWADFTEPATRYERLDFRLRKQDNTRHGVLLITDQHLHGKRRDEATFTKYMDVINREANAFKTKGIPAYSIGLGDMSYDNYWYETGVDLSRTREILNENKWPLPFYNIMGNHDSDGAVCKGDSTDFLSAFKFMQTYGPRYFSTNIGRVHYVMLDNIYYINEPAKTPQNEGINGKRNYKELITAEQLDWLEKDLSFITPETPVIVAMHCPMHVYKKATNEIQLRPDEESSLRLKEILKPFKRALFVSGHTHKNGIVRTKNGDNELIDLNLVSTSGSIWWNSSFNQKNLAHDGNPVGFEVMEIDGDKIEWRFVPYEYPANMQYKAWDVNTLKMFFSTDTEALTFQRHLPKWGKYEKLPDNSVLIQVWAWDPNGKLTVRENGKELAVKDVWEVHPDYYAMTAIQKGEWQGDYKKGLREPKKARMFLVKASSPDTPLEISYTDAFGRTDSRTFSRPHFFESNPLPDSVE